MTAPGMLLGGRLHESGTTRGDLVDKRATSRPWMCPVPGLDRTIRVPRRDDLGHHRRGARARTGLARTATRYACRPSPAAAAMPGKRPSAACTTSPTRSRARRRDNGTRENATTTAPLPDRNRELSDGGPGAGRDHWCSGIGWFLRPTPVAPEARLEFNTLPTTDVSLAISPDGLTVVFVVGSGGTSQLWLRPLDVSSPRLLPGTTGGSRPFWSPDGRSIGFFADGSLSASTSTAIGADIDVRGRRASRRNVEPRRNVLFADNPGGPIRRTSQRGGEPAEVTRADASTARALLSRVPARRPALSLLRKWHPEARGVYVGQLDSPESTRLFDAAGAATYASTGHLLFARQNKLLAQRFDAARRKVAAIRLSWTSSSARARPSPHRQPVRSPIGHG